MTPSSKYEAPGSNLSAVVTETRRLLGNTSGFFPKLAKFDSETVCATVERMLSSRCDR